MSSWLLAVPALGAAAWLAVSLLLARKLADRYASDQFSIVRYVVLTALALALAAVATWFDNPWLFTVAASAFVFVVALFIAFELHGGPAQRRLAIVQPYVLVCGLEYAHLWSRGMVTGTRASPLYALALDDLLGQLTIFATAGVVPKSAPAWALPAQVVGALAQTLSSHILVMTAAATFVVVAFAAAYLAESPLAAPGAELLPVPTACSAVFGVMVIAAWLAPGPLGTAFSLGAILFLPFYLSEALVLLHRWMQPLSVRLFLLALLVALSIRLPTLGVLLVLLGWLGQLLRLRELLPFAALVENPMARPRLASLLGTALVLTSLLGTSAGVAYASLRRVSPKLGAAPEICGGVKSSVSWETRMVAFTTGDGSFSMDVDEAPLPAGVDSTEQLQSACAAAGKRLCTSDEWYVACLCTYPRDAEAGAKLSGNYFAAARAEQERKAPAPGASASTLTSDKQSEVRALLTGRAEVVSGGVGGGVLLAGPSEAMGDPWTEDCRYRALISPSAVRRFGETVAGLRCCR